MTSEQDTIAAVATAPGEAGIAIVRLSGPRSLAIADRLFHGSAPCPSERPGNTFARGFLHAPGGEMADEVVLLVYRAPHSYTREDVVEIQGHGGRTCARRILRAVLDAGARPAEPGEFTRRAFLNGRIDLVQAEAVLDLVRSASDRAAAAAVEQLRGCLSDCIATTYDNIVSAAADLEASLDFDEDELPEAARAAPVRRLNEAADDLETLLATWEEGRLLREGARVVIAGGPNVGKSTLLNVLLGTDRAIVTDVPGTTRDTIEEPLVLEGIPLRLIDTAGLRDSDCRVEGEGVRRARAAMEAADLVIHVLDASAPGQAPAGLPPDKTILLLNKIDLGQVVATESVQPFDAVPASLKTGQGVPELKALIVSKLGLHTDAPPHAAISERHRHLVQGALNELNSAREVLHGKDEALLVAAASSLRQALDCLGRIVGKVYDQDLLDAVFQKFCIGK